MKKTYIIIISLMIAGIYGASAQSTLAGKAAQLQAAVEGITADPALSEAVMSICARSGDGRTSRRSFCEDVPKRVMIFL